MNQYDCFPFLQKLEAQWEDVLSELTNLLYNEAENSVAYFYPWHEKDLYDGQWDVYSLYNEGRKITSNCKRCPKTTALLESIPKVQSASFSALSPESYIHTHTGDDTSVWSCHLGLIVPDPLPDHDRRATCILTANTCGMRVDDDVYHWYPGKAQVFDDTLEHCAWNWGNRTRFILMFNFKK